MYRPTFLRCPWQIPKTILRLCLKIYIFVQNKTKLGPTYFVLYILS